MQRPRMWALEVLNGLLLAAERWQLPVAGVAAGRQRLAVGVAVGVAAGRQTQVSGAAAGQQQHRFVRTARRQCLQRTAAACCHRVVVGAVAGWLRAEPGGGRGTGVVPPARDGGCAGAPGGRRGEGTLRVASGGGDMHGLEGRRVRVGASDPRCSSAWRLSGDIDVGQALGRSRGICRTRSATATGEGGQGQIARGSQYVHPLYAHLLSEASPVDESSLEGRARDARALPHAVFSCPPLHRLLPDGSVVAQGVVDAACQLISSQDLPSRFSAASLRSLGEGATNAPCRTLGNGTLMEGRPGTVSVRTLVWETRMTE